MKTPQELKDMGYSLDKDASRLFIKPSSELNHGNPNDMFYARDILANPEKYNNTEVYHFNAKLFVQIQDKKNTLLLTYSNDRMPPESRMNYNYLLSTEYSPGNSIIDNINNIEASLKTRAVVADGLAASGEYSLFVGFKGTGLTLCLLKAVVNQIATGEVDAKNVVYMTGNATKKAFLDIAKELSKYGVETVYVDNLPIAESKTRPFVMKKQLPGLMNHYIDLKEADKTVIIIDMLKNVCGMENSKDVIEFNSSIRKFTMEGGTVLINASPNKDTKKTGIPTPPGFNDTIEGCDSLFLVVKEEDGNTTTVKYENESGAIKDKEVYWQFKNDCSGYSEAFNSCVRVSAEEIKNAKKVKDEFTTLEQRAKDLDNNIEVFKFIDGGVVAKTKLIEEVAKQCNLSKPKAKIFLEKYTDKYWICSPPKSGGGTKEYSTKYTEDLLQRDARSDLCPDPYIEIEELSCYDETLEYVA
jgi:hypothetical protein